MPNRVVVGSQWGDEGKAKVVDFLTEDADIVVRFQGGANAGHTVEVGDEKYVFHLVPSGIMRPEKVCIIGNGVVLDPKQILLELKELEGKNIDFTGRLLLSESAHVVFPFHKKLDQLSEIAAGKNAIGTTGRGIGPAYTDKVRRLGLRVCDLMDEKGFKGKLYSLCDVYNTTIQKLYGESSISASEVYEEYMEYAKALKPYVSDTIVYLNQAIKAGKNILFEGAQGTFLDLDHGTHPYITSSNTVAAAACVGSGVGPKHIHEVYGVVKAYTTRVGNGPFPTELSGSLGEQLQSQGHEFGATTGRPRRCGWVDLVLLKKAAMVNGLTHLAITKMDVMDNFKEIKMCVGYNIRGKLVENFPCQSELLEEVEPVYETVAGWNESTKGITHWDQLPKNAKNYLQLLSEKIDVPIGMVSLGPKRHQTIVVENSEAMARV